MRIKQTLVIISGKSVIEFASVTFNENETEPAQRLSAAKMIVKYALMAAQQMFPASERPTITVSTRTSGA